MKKMNKKGFTLAELLIVVAIIAVLVAIAIPVFSSQLSKAKAATDAANIRSGYAEIATLVVTGEASDGTYYLQADGTVATADTNLYKCKGASGDLTDSATAYIGTTAVSTIAWAKDSNIKYVVSGETITIGKK